MGRESQNRTFTLNFTVLAFKIWAYSSKIAEIGNFWYNFPQNPLKRFLQGHIMTSHLQFGFKKGHSTTMCSLVVKETIEYYNAHRSTVNCTMLDATKAFDRVQYCKFCFVN